MQQTKLGSLTEAVVSTILGLALAMSATAFIAHSYDIPITARHNFILTAWMTVLSVVRSYVLRRAFNGMVLRRYWYRWKWRHQDASVCCCGAPMGKGGSICGHGGCKSMRDYVIERELASFKKD